MLFSLTLALLTGCGGGGSPTPITPPGPTLTSLSPNTITAGGAGFTLTVNGSDFVTTSDVRWDGATLATTFVNSTQLTAAVLPGDIATGATVQVTVFNPDGSGTSNALTFTINNPLPSVTSLIPSSAPAGGGNFTLTLDGTGFVMASVVRWNGSDRITTFFSSTQLTATIPLTDVAAEGTAQVTVFNPAPVGGTSSALPFSITAPLTFLITTSALPDTTGGTVYDFTLATTGGTAPITWGLAAGSTLPTSLTLDSATGRISGTVNPVGTDTPFPFTVEATDNGGQTATQNLAITVFADPASLGRNDTWLDAVPISNGTLRASISPYGDEDFYAIQVSAGAIVAIEIIARRLTPQSFLDSVLELRDSADLRPMTCKSPDQPRNPINPFIVNDPTPDDFDDLCVCDDIDLGVIQDSRFEFQPTVGGTFFIRLLDFRGDGRPELIYDLRLSGAN